MRDDHDHSHFHPQDHSDPQDPHQGHHTAPATPPRRRGLRTSALGVTGAVIATAAGAGLWWGAATVTATATATAIATADDLVQNRLDSLVELGYPGVLATVTDANGTEHEATAGTGDLATGTPVPVDGEVRVGSNTKTFTATVVLQLVDEGAVELDAPVEQYLPGVVRGEGIDPTRITVRQLLQHTSGLPEYTADIAQDIVDLRDSYRSPRDLLDAALEQPAQFEPGERWAYTNTNYLLLGLLVEQVTERPLFEQVTERIIEPLGLQHTYFPVPGERDLRGEHPTGYHVDEQGELVDITSLDPSWGWAAGAMVSTPSELNEFMRALVEGELLEAGTLEQMMETVPQEDPFTEGSGYGLGLIRYPLSCGGEVWGHGGDIHGYQTRNAVATDGRAYTVAVTALPWALVDPDDEEALMPMYQAVVDTVDAAFCEEPG